MLLSDTRLKSINRWREKSWHSYRHDSDDGEAGRKRDGKKSLHYFNLSVENVCVYVNLFSAQADI